MAPSLTHCKIDLKNSYIVSKSRKIDKSQWLAAGFMRWPDSKIEICHCMIIHVFLLTQ